MSGESDDRESDDGESDDSESGDNETSEEHCNISDRLHPLIEALKRLHRFQLKKDLKDFTRVIIGNSNAN